MIFNVTGGGGAALNFKVVGYATEEALLAATPAENTIGIITETPLTGYIFSVEEPSPATAGLVWVTIGTSSQVAFNALKKNSVMVYPLSAKQYIDGAWVDVTAKSYQGGEWVDWWDGVLYYLGDQCEKYTGGWVKRGTAANTLTVGSVTFNTDSITLSTSAASSGAGQYNVVHCTTENLIDVSGYKTLEVTVTTKTGSAAISLYDKDSTWDGQSTRVAALSLTDLSAGTHALDISEISGEYYIGFLSYSEYGGSGKLVVTEVKLS